MEKGASFSLGFNCQNRSGPAEPILAAKVVRGTNFSKIFCQNRSSPTDFGVKLFKGHMAGRASSRDKYGWILKLLKILGSHPSFNIIAVTQNYRTKLELQIQ